MGFELLWVMYTSGRRQSMQERLANIYMGPTDLIILGVTLKGQVNLRNQEVKSDLKSQLIASREHKDA
ncbi:hypothetical protein NC653_001571 [Populus alba x Populus x berolinensis]|uniref:Uncharacterized protein n=1 Tax=Populus alba x Populus x berolinensis TaxID=444605 RepID=A0AAD6WGP9_9ROSI|nr:hypothetical protein NC653_001571 [Populus alba x Populus x berolinensis]